MEIFTQSSLFVAVVGVAQIIIAVFLVFILGLLVKIFSDVSYIVGRFKKETDEVIADVEHLRHEAKSLVNSASGYMKLFVSAAGIKKAFGLLSGFLEKNESRKKTRVVKVKKSTKNKKD